METKKTYSEQLKDPRWQKKRLEIMQRDEFFCHSCSDNQGTLNVHHLSYKKNYNLWDYDNSDLITLCEFCHNKATENSRKSIALIRKNAIDIVSSEQYFEILNILDGFDWEKLVKVHRLIKSL